ncbi:MAG TPA: AAA domain-containing protein [Bacteroidales bacterium]|nr:AAA domain-containing protein [Bacteroidales bacterium]
MEKNTKNIEKTLIKNPKFLNILREKLSRGNKRSIHLNVLPGRSATRIDLLDLDQIKPGLSKKLIEKLLSHGNFKLEISFPEEFDINTLDEKIQQRLLVAIRRLKSISKQNKDYFLEHGVEPFGFGFPIIYKRDKKDPSNIIKAPLLIWSLEIEEDRRYTNKWIIKREDDYPIYINEVLISHIENDEGIKIEKLQKEYLEDSIIDEGELVEISQNFLLRFGSNLPQDEVKSKIFRLVESGYYKDHEDLINTKPAILGGGVLGLYINQKQSIIQDVNLLIEESNTTLSEELIQENFKINPFASIETDPSQQKILNDISINNTIIIHGPPGTGKSQSLTAVISNALANKAKCLVVCEKRTALDVIYNNLKSVDLDRLCGLIEDTSKDRKKIIEKARSTIDNIRDTKYYYTDYKFNEIEYNDLLEKLKAFIVKENNYHKTLSEKLVGNKNWTDLVGEFLKQNKHVDIGVLDKELPYSDFKYCESEYRELSEKVTQASVLLKKYNPKDNTLELLNEQYFVDKSFLNIKQIFDEMLYLQIEKLNNILQHIDSFIEEYKNTVLLEAQRQMEQFNELLVEMKSIWSNYSKRKSFTESGFIYSLSNNFLALFSSKAKAIKTARIKYFENAKRISLLVSANFLNKLDFSCDNLSLKEICEVINDIEVKNNTWYTNIETFAEELKSKININEYFNIGNIDKEIKAICQECTDIFNEINNTGLFHIKLVLLEKLSSIKQILTDRISLIQKTISHKDEVFDYSNWHKFINVLNPKEKKLILFLSKQGITNINSLFNSWYFNRLLDTKYCQTLDNLDDLINSIVDGLDVIKKENTKKALSYWQQKRIDSIYRYNQKHSVTAKQLFSFKNHNNKKKTLRQIIDIDFELFTDIFPVLLVNPSVCSSLFKLKENLFDVVIFDEASQLRIEDTFCALIRGKIKIISGDEHQMPPSSYFQASDFSLDTGEEIEDETLESFEMNELADLAYKESLLEYASEHYHDSYLEIHYRSRHPRLIDFSNAAFYSNRLNPLPPIIDYKPIRYIAVNGLYENQINQLEARQVIKIIRDNIKKDAKGDYPSLGIATFNIHQRNLIWDEINKESRIDADFGSKLEKLFEKGLFIKNLENIQGDERDVIILSTTFGKNKNGIFSEKFGPLNVASKGHRLLNVIITRAKYQVFICSSFPTEKIQQYKELISQNGNVGRGILYAYLAYAKAIEEDNIETINFIIDLLLSQGINTSQSNNYQTLFGTESPFEQEVVDSLLRNGITEDRIELQHKCGGFRIDIIVKDLKTKKPIIAIECDGAAYHESQEAYLWDVFRQKQLETCGFKFYRIWSTNWWKNQDQEIRRLISFISSFDNKSATEDSSSPVYLLNNDIDFVKNIDIAVKESSKVTLIHLKTNKNLIVNFTKKSQTKLSINKDCQEINFETPLYLTPINWIKN